MALVTLLGGLLTLGCAPEQPPGPPSGNVIVTAGDIADCFSDGDEATARLVSSIEGTVLTLGDNAYENGTAKDFSECYEPSWGQFKERTKPIPETTSTKPKGPRLLRLLRGGRRRPR